MIKTTSFRLASSMTKHSLRSFTKSWMTQTLIHSAILGDEPFEDLARSLAELPEERLDKGCALQALEPTRTTMSILILPDEMLLKVLGLLTLSQTILDNPQSIQDKYLHTSTLQHQKVNGTSLIEVMVTCKRLFGICVTLLWRNMEITSDDFGNLVPDLNKMDEDRMFIYGESMRCLTISISQLSFMSLENLFAILSEKSNQLHTLHMVAKQAGFSHGVTQNLSEYDVDALISPKPPPLKHFTLQGRWTMSPDTMVRLITHLPQLERLHLSLLMPKERTQEVSSAAAGRENAKATLISFHPLVHPLPLKRLELTLGDTDDIHALHTIGVDHLLKMCPLVTDLRLGFFTPRRSMVEHVNFHSGNEGGMVTMESFTLPHDLLEETSRLLTGPQLVRKAKGTTPAEFSLLFETQFNELTEYVRDEAIMPTVDLLFPIGWVLVNLRTPPIGIASCDRLTVLHLSLPNLSDAILHHLCHGDPLESHTSPPSTSLLKSIRLIGGGTAGSRGVTDLGIYTLLRGMPRLAHLAMSYIDISHISLQLIRDFAPPHLGTVELKTYGGIRLDHLSILASRWGSNFPRTFTFHPELLPLDSLHVTNLSHPLEAMREQFTANGITLHLNGILKG